jgi:hypothetical protein
VKLADLRKLAIRRQIRIRFGIRNGMECVITEHGVAQVEALKGAADFNLEEELAAATNFQLDPLNASKKNPPASKGAPVSTLVGREELAAMAGGGPAAEAPAHDDD